MQPDAPSQDFDVVFVGGGLASVLSALALLTKQPRLRVAIVERQHTLGGNHTWCFHAGDVPAAAAPWFSPLVVQRWEGYVVRFPRRERHLSSPYACVSSARLHEFASERLVAAHCELLLGHNVTTMQADRVQLDDGRTLTAALVVDARGPTPSHDRHRGYQKFVGLELAAPGHGFSQPLLFDACIAQHDGFRFMYVLPLARDRLLVEETFFSDGAALDAQRGERAVLAYADAQGLDVRAVVRHEQGVLPMPWRDAPIDLDARPLRAGYGAGLFHPVTGYSLPIAVRFALALADSDLGRLSDSPLSRFTRAFEAQRPFLHLLARLMFRAFSPEQRFSVLEHFYRLPPTLIERFYAAELTPLDRARVFLGAPPRGFSLGRALGIQGAPT